MKQNFIMKKIIMMLLVLAGGISTASADDDTWTLRGDFNDWKALDEYKFDADGKLEVTFTVGQTINFKLVKNDGYNDIWYGLSGTVNYTANSGLNFNSNTAANAYLIAGEAGKYTFTIDKSGEQPILSVTYPEYTGKIYFCNNLGWTNPYVYILTSFYWDDSNDNKGSGSNGRPNGIAMTQIGSTNIWKASCPSSITADGFYIAFVEGQQDNYNNFWNTKAVYRGDFKTESPLFISSTSVTGTHNGTKYFSNGTWHKYPTITREVTSGNYGTICMPFDATVSGANVFKIVSTVGTGDNVSAINLESVTSLEAGKAYIYLATGSTLAATANGNGIYAPQDEYGMKGNLSSSNEVLDGLGSTTYYVVSGNKIKKVVDGGTGVNVGQYRGYITLTGIGEAESRGAYFLGFDDEATGIKSINDEKDLGEIYNLQGQRVMNAQKGLFIVGGKKMLMK